MTPSLRDYDSHPVTLDEAHAIANPPAPARPPPDLTPVWAASGAAFLLFATWSVEFSLSLFGLCVALSMIIRAAFRKRRR